MYAVRGLLSILARLMIAAIFVLAAVNKVSQFNDVAKGMEAEGVPQPKILLAGAIACLVLGGLSLVLGYRPRLGALLLLVFLGAATYYFHDFWKLPPDTPKEEWGREFAGFLKNVALMGTMVFLIANGTGPWSASNRTATPDEGDGGDSPARPNQPVVRTVR